MFSHLGSHAYDMSITVNTWFNKLRKFFGLPYWSLSNFLKRNVKGAVNYLGKFERHLARYAKRNGCDGVITGHVHTPSDKIINGVHYLNCGDFVESMTAIVEHYDGSFQIIEWS